MSTLQETGSAVGTWRLDPVHSSVGFEVPYLGGSFRGSFRSVKATLAVDETAARLEGSADVASVDVKDENLTAHLQSPDFFDAERHPELSFAADGFALDVERVSVPGELTIKGVTKPVELSGTVAAPIVDPYGNERLGLKLSTTVDRTAFGVSWNAPLPSGEQALANDVALTAELYFVREA
ncbi:MAG TPA: YceI family protein [Gaiellaceae bacterium]|jgi:polyisoprenoid-binding protein YceI